MKERSLRAGSRAFFPVSRRTGASCTDAVSLPEVSARQQIDSTVSTSHLTSNTVFDTLFLCYDIA